VEPLTWIAIALAVASAAALLLWWHSARGASRLTTRLAEERSLSAESRLLYAASSERLSEVLQGCGAGIVWLDREAVVAQANDRAGELFDLTPEEMKGKPLLHVTLSSDLQEAVRKALIEGTGSTLEVRGVGPNHRTLSVSVRPSSGSGQSAAILFAHDVTEVRRLETVRRDFVANVSHELRTPLASIRAMAETLEAGARMDDNVADRFLATIVNESDRLARIAEDLLVLSDAESHEPDKSQFDLSLLLEDVLARFAMRAQLEGVSLSKEVPAGIRIVASQDQVEQTVSNLVDNAIKYTPSGGSVNVRLTRTNGNVRIEVSDTGIGLLQEDVPRIFERFYRVDKARSRKSGGTGLGLSIVKHVVESHAGRVAVESEFNRGSCFAIELPTGLPGEDSDDEDSERAEATASNV